MPDAILHTLSVYTKKNECALHTSAKLHEMFSMHAIDACCMHW